MHGKRTMNIYLVGYIPPFWKKKHTNFWPWNYLATTFNQIGYKAQHINASRINHKKPGVYICWNAPDSLELIEKYKPHKDSIIIQKLTSFDGSKTSDRGWTSDALGFFKDWHWPQYQKLDTLENSGYRYFAFGAKTDVDTFPIKAEIVKRHSDRIFWIPWGTMTVPHQRIMEAKPILDGFQYDLGFVGSKWGTKERGNVSDWDQYLQPIIDQADTVMLAGRGTEKGPVSVNEHIRILERSRLCPNLHATSWKVEKGIMDRFWTVFSLGRFGLVENEGILHHFNEDEVVLETDPGEYIEKSLYFMKHVDQQEAYIKKVLSRIQTEYNQQVVWKRILDQVVSS